MASIKPKRGRAANFTGEEKRLCLQLVHKYRHIVENKKTDALSKEQKDRIWITIAKEFNAQSPAFIKRTTENLKHFYDNQKKLTRKYAAEENFQMRKTGGGTADVKPADPLHELTLSVLNTKTVVGLESRFDYDAQSSNLFSSSEPVESITCSDEETSENIPNYIQTQEEELESASVSNIKDCAITITKRPVKQDASKTWTKRRRPALNALLNLAKSYEDLSETKRELANLQLSLLKKQYEEEVQKFAHEREIREAEKENENENRYVKKQLLEAELERTRQEIDYWKSKKEKEAEKHELEKQAVLLDLKIKKQQSQNLINI